MARTKVTVEGVIAESAARSMPSDTVLITPSGVFMNKANALVWLKNESTRTRERAMPGPATTPEEVYGRLARAKQLEDLHAAVNSMTVKNKTLIDMRKVDHTQLLPVALRAASPVDTKVSAKTKLNSVDMGDIAGIYEDKDTLDEPPLDPIEIDEDEDVDEDDE